MLFTRLATSSLLTVENYFDIDHFRQSESYARAESTPLNSGQFRVKRAQLAMPSCTVSLVRTFPRLVNGYDLTGRLLIVVPMNEISSARINGMQVEQSIIVLKGKTSCTVLEPEGRLVGILSIEIDALGRKWKELDSGVLLLRLPQVALLALQGVLKSVLWSASNEEFAEVGIADTLFTLQSSIFSAFDEILSRGEFQGAHGIPLLMRYKTIVDSVDGVISVKPGDTANGQLADELGISVRTLQTASKLISGHGAQQYVRLRRLWSVRKQLRSGASGLTIKASAIAHGFWHMSEFTNLYRRTFGELPSQTLASARGRRGAI